MHLIRRIRQRQGFSRGADRDSPRTYVALGLIFVGLVVAGVLIGVADESAAPVLETVTPTSIPDAPTAPSAGIVGDATATP